MVTLTKDLQLASQVSGPSPPPDRYGQPNKYTIVFTDAHKQEPLELRGARVLIDEMRHRYPGMLFYNAVVGQKAETRADTGEIVAVKDRISFIRATPYFPHLEGYIHVDESTDRTVATSDSARLLGGGLERTLGRENFDLMLRRLQMSDVRIVFENEQGLYFTLFPVDSVPELHDYIDDPTAPVPASLTKLKRTMEDLGRTAGILYRSTIIPTLSKKPFPHTTVSMNDLRRMRNLRRQDDFDSTLEFYGMLNGWFEAANGDPAQFLSFDKKSFPKNTEAGL